jgi:CheY-like chemotaxis protein
MDKTAKGLNYCESEANALAAQPRKTGSPRIVLVEDENWVLEMLEILIRDWFKNPTLLSFQDGETAWQELLRTDPDLLITDMNRNGMTGWEMLPLLAQRKVKYPILVQSGQATEMQVLQCAGPDLNVTFLQKPWTAAEFRRQLLIHLGLRDRMPMAIVRFQRLRKPLPGGLIPAFGGEKHPLGQQVREHADILMALTDIEFIHAHATHLAKIGLGISRLHVLEEHAPQARVAFPTSSATWLMGISRISSNA